MPIKDPAKRREYQRELMRKKRNQGLTKNVSPELDPKLLDPTFSVSPQNVSPDNSVSPNVSPEPKKLDPASPQDKMLDPPKNVSPKPKVEPVEPQPNNVEPYKCFYCHQRPAEKGEAYCLVCAEWLKERSEWKARVFKRDEIIKELEGKPCSQNHYSLADLFQQASEQVKSSWAEIISQGGSNQCANCHNSQINHQLAINLLEKYWSKVKKLEKGENM